MKVIKKWGVIGLAIVPFVLGIIGFLDQFPQKYFDACYFSLKLYGFDCDVDKITPILELARWTAPLATLTTFFLTIKAISQKIVLKVLLLQKGTIAIYGTSNAAHCLLKDINQHSERRRAVLVNDFVPAHIQVLMLDSDETNLLFFSRNFKKFKQADRIYLQLEDFDPYILNCNNIDLYSFSLSDLTAQLYWREQAKWLCEKIYTCDTDVTIKVCLIGGGVYGEKLLHYGLLSNIYSADHSIEYHLFGEWEECQAIHFNWNDIVAPKDRIVFHDEPWYQWAKQLMQMDRIIVCDDDQKKNLHIAQRIQSFVPNCELDIRLLDDTILNTNMLSRRTGLFGAYNRLCSQQLILQEQLIQDAREQHEAYMRKHPENKIDEWIELDAFTRQSNISSSFFQNVNIPLIKSKISELTESEQNELLAELEHIRWCRYHFLYNWKYKSGKKDRTHRTHSDLIPYKKLSKEEQEKDLDAVNR